MEQNYRFCYQGNQFWGDCIPCTPAVFNKAIDDAMTAWKIDMRQKVEEAIQNGAALDNFIKMPEFEDFCMKKQNDKNFTSLPHAMQLLQWATSLKSSLPCFIFGVKDFVLVEKTDKDGKDRIVNVRQFEVKSHEGNHYTFETVFKPKEAGSYKFCTRMYPKSDKLPHRQDFCYVKWLD